MLENMVLAKELAKSVKINLGSLKTIATKIVKDGVKDPPMIPPGVANLLIKQTEDFGGLSNFLRAADAESRILGSNNHLENILEHGIFVPNADLEGFVYLVERKGKVFFRDSIVMQYTIPAEFTKKGEPYRQPTKWYRADAIKELTILLLFPTKIPKKKVPRREDLMDVNFPMIVKYSDGQHQLATYISKVHHPIASPSDPSADTNSFRHAITQTRLKRKARAYRIPYPDRSYLIVLCDQRDISTLFSQSPKLSVVDNLVSREIAVMRSLKSDLLGLPTPIYVQKDEPLWARELVKMAEKFNKYQ